MDRIAHSEIGKGNTNYDESYYIASDIKPDPIKLRQVDWRSF